jgi:hypothetical protein
VCPDFIVKTGLFFCALRLLADVGEYTAVNIEHMTIHGIAGV